VHLFLSFTKPGTNTCRIGDRLVWDTGGSQSPVICIKFVRD
jgi:hypothetical protein